MTITERLSAALAGRYRIERELGAGGMATARGHGHVAARPGNRQRAALRRDSMAEAIQRPRAVTHFAEQALRCRTARERAP